jgi:hypothetical protein
MRQSPVISMAVLISPSGHYERTCQSCSLQSPDSAVLTCECQTAWGTNTPNPQNGIIDLSQHIGVYNGHLLSNLSGPPIVPSSPSKYPVPSDFTYHFGGIATCENDSEGVCSNAASKCSTSSPVDRTDASETLWQFSQPLTCYVPTIYFPDLHYVFSSFKLAAEGAWEVLGYADEACSGEPVVYGAGDAGVCKVLERPIKAVTIRPLFNGDAQ